MQKICNSFHTVGAHKKNDNGFCAVGVDGRSSSPGDLGDLEDLKELGEL